MNVVRKFTFKERFSVWEISVACFCFYLLDQGKWPEALILLLAGAVVAVLMEGERGR